MAANLSQTFPLTPNIGYSRISIANVARDGSGTASGVGGTAANIYTTYTPGANGDIVLRFTVTDSDPTSSSTSLAQVVRFFIKPTGVTASLYKELLMPAVAGTTGALSGTINYTIPGGIYVPTGSTIVTTATLATATTGQVDVVIEGISY